MKNGTHVEKRERAATVKQERVVISAHNPTMRTALRLVALTAPFWAIYVTGQFLGIFGFFLNPVFFDPNARIFWMLAAFSVGVSGSCLLLLNTIVLSKEQIDFPPLKAARLPIEDVEQVIWHWDSYEREAYVRFLFQSGEFIDIHSSRLSPKKIAALNDALRRFAPRCDSKVHAEDLEDPIALRDRFYRPIPLTLVQSSQSPAGDKSEKPQTFQTCQTSQTSQSIDVPYHPHKQLDDFYRSLGANEKYFWYCWLTVMLVPCLLKLPDIVWGFIADFRHIERFVDVPTFVQAVHGFTEGAWSLACGGIGGAGVLFYGAASHPFGICILLGIAILSLIAFGMFVFQPNGITLKSEGLELFFHWNKLVLFQSLRRWNEMVAFQLDQFGDVVNPEKWRMQIKMSDGSTVNLKIEAIKGTQAKESLLRTITEMAPDAALDPALIRALTAAQKQSYTELWLQSLATPPKRSRLAPLGQGQKLKAGRYLVERQLAVGGQGVAYVALDVSQRETLGNSLENKLGNSVGNAALGNSITGSQAQLSADVVLKEFVLPVYTSRAVRKQALERFENEARILTELDHPQIVKLRDYFLEDHRAYLVMDHIDGMSLRKLVQESGPLDAQQLLNLSEQMCSVLQYLHAKSPPVVHRDFTPDNLILDKRGKLVLIDFNVAQQRQWTTTGTVVGKHAYLPPEQFRGTPSTQSDLYAMGATLFFLSTGSDPEPISCSHPARRNSKLSSSFDKLVAGLTAIELENRYTTIADVWKDVESMQSGEIPGEVCRVGALATHDEAVTCDQSDSLQLEEREKEAVFALRRASTNG